MTPIIEFKNYTFKYRSQSEPTLREIDLTVNPGEKVLIVGPSGSGKSTLVHCINGMVPFSYPGESSGTLTVGGKDPAKTGIFGMSKIVGTVLQDTDGQFIGLTVAEDVAFALENDCVEQEEMFRAVDEVAEVVDIKALLGNAPTELSGGQKKRVAIAGVLAMNPKILILDEPTAGLDPKGRDDILDQIAELHKVRGITIILVSHSMEDIAKYAERLIVVNDGEIAYDDAPKAVFAHYRELEAMGLAAPQITYIMHALKEKGLDVDVTATTVDEAKENILAVLRKCNPGKLSGDKQSVSDSQSKKENAKAETLISEMEADLTEDGTKESHSDAPDEDLSIQKETMDKKSAEQEENEGGQEV